MSLYEHLYDESEQAKVRFVGFASDKARHDFGIIYSTQFFGKPLVVCMQTGRSSLICGEDANDIAHLQRTFQIEDQDEARNLSEFLKVNLPIVTLDNQY